MHTNIALSSQESEYQTRFTALMKKEDSYIYKYILIYIYPSANMHTNIYGHVYTYTHN
jgi:hypothetical protein